MQPLVISQDIGSILGGAGLPKQFFASLGIRRGYDGLLAEVRNDLQEIFSSVFSNFEYLSEEELALGFNKKLKAVRDRGMAVVCLDRVYADSTLTSEQGHYWLDVTRMYDTAGKSTLRPRLHGKFSHMAPDEMVASIARDLTKKGITQIALADDVIFSGGSIVKTAEQFAKNGIIVTDVVSCVAIEDGVKALAKAGIRVDSVRRYENVLDQICERDFLCGIPQSGVLMMIDGKLVKRPYILPFGDIVKRASVPPEHAVAVSELLLGVSAKLWRGLENLAGKHILGRDLPENVDGIAPDARVVDSILQGAAVLRRQGPAVNNNRPAGDRPNAYTITN
ncbi:MAG: hypothetical protein EBQ96_01025 [Proteobacteria bacterium]|nr:hypothetical protein [Pseudomonadota bacterium]